MQTFPCCIAAAWPCDGRHVGMTAAPAFLRHHPSMPGPAMCAPRWLLMRIGAILSSKRPATSCTCIPSPVSASRYAFSATTTRKPQSPILQVSSGRLPYLKYALFPLTFACRTCMSPGRNLWKRKVLLAVLVQAEVSFLTNFGGVKRFTAHKAACRASLEHLTVQSRVQLQHRRANAGRDAMPAKTARRTNTDLSSERQCRATEYSLNSLTVKEQGGIS